MMAPRPRKPGRRDLPPNLYLSCGYYRYRRPDTGTWHQMGTDKQRAIAAAKTLNARLLQGPADLVGAVLDTVPSITVADFIDTMLQWDQQRFASLDELCRILDIPQASTLTGADVWPLWQAGRHEEIAAYCAEDVRLVREVFHQMTYGTYRP